MSNEIKGSEPPITDEDFVHHWDTNKAAAFLDLSPKTLRNNRGKGGSLDIPFVKLGSRVIYNPRTLVRHAALRTRRTTSDPGSTK